MRHWALRFAMLGLGGLALVTTALNHLALERGYRVGEAVREADDLAQVIASRRDRCRRLLRTADLALTVERLGLTPDELFPPIHPFEWAPVALGTP